MPCRRPLRRPTLQFWPRVASERLPQADIELEGVAVGCSIHRQGDIETNGADRRVVARAESGTDPRPTGEGKMGRTYLARIDKGGSAEIAEETLAEFNCRRGDGGSADRIAVGKLRPDRLILEASHGRAAAGVEPLVGREVELRRAFDAADEGAQGD